MVLTGLAAFSMAHQITCRLKNQTTNVLLFIKVPFLRIDGNNVCHFGK
jgi:hypothetical protein